MVVHLKVHPSLCRTFLYQSSIRLAEAIVSRLSDKGDLRNCLFYRRVDLNNLPQAVSHIRSDLSSLSNAEGCTVDILKKRDTACFLRRAMGNEALCILAYRFLVGLTSNKACIGKLHPNPNKDRSRLRDIEHPPDKLAARIALNRNPPSPHRCMKFLCSLPGGPPRGTASMPKRCSANKGTSYRVQ